MSTADLERADLTRGAGRQIQDCSAAAGVCVLIDVTEIIICLWKVQTQYFTQPV